MEDVMKCSANYVPLTPISFLERAAKLYPHAPSLVHGDTSFTWKLTHQRCILLSSALSSHFQISYGDVVAALLPSIPELYELHYGIPMAGGVLSTLNPDLDASSLSRILQELEPKIIFLYQLHLQSVVKVLKLLDKNLIKDWPVLVIIKSDDPGSQGSVSSSCILEIRSPPSCLHYEELLEMGQIDFEPVSPKHECDPILVNYTSGSTGNPKGVVYSHRAAYLNTIGEIFRSDLREQRIVFLWTADLFRANGWGFTWGVAALGGTNVFPRSIDAGNHLLDSILLHGVTHLSGHPSVLFKILEEAHNRSDFSHLSHKVYAHIAGILPPTDTMTKIENMGFQVVHRYGMTEVLGAPISRLWQSDHSAATTLLKLKPVNSNIMDHMMEEIDVKDPQSMRSVPCDGKTIGEVMFRGNALMMGYLKNTSEATRVFQGGWFHTGDLAMKNKDGWIQLKDRAKDIIKVSKGESVSTLEIEAVLSTHPKVLEVAVVGMPKHGDDLSNGEVPCAFLKLKNAVYSSQEEIMQFCKDRLPVKMIPQLVHFGDLAVNSTGKVQKVKLREAAKVMSSQQGFTGN